jgi:hypothetical protein
MEKLNVFNAICAGFADAPSICKDTLGIVTPDAFTKFKKSLAGHEGLTT